MASASRTLTESLVFLQRLRELESDLQNHLYSVDETPRPRLVEALSFMEKADQALTDLLMQSPTEQPAPRLSMFYRIW
jgi:hypothetical protein